ncbi:hypothetical protein SCP_1103780 [Sparassis crispa]|uniref:Uncharacterized protein n=1 Tax=Sparassis crispa TaxID=139825 RepID=A0A401GZV7_9APHY|nr:hypothetical protein SCP_1103780 [Sparassis crispa]GBE87701.1 hypothetical protein SCP_1103780 [Sparassis crispa]
MPRNLYVTGGSDEEMDEMISWQCKANDRLRRQAMDQRTAYASGRYLAEREETAAAADRESGAAEDGARGRKARIEEGLEGMRGSREIGLPDRAAAHAKPRRMLARKDDAGRGKNEELPERARNREKPRVRLQSAATERARPGRGGGEKGRG